MYTNDEISISRRVGMADEADSKSVVGNHVWVQVPSPAVYFLRYRICRFFYEFGIFYFPLRGRFF